MISFHRASTCFRCSHVRIQSAKPVKRLLSSVQSPSTEDFRKLSSARDSRYQIYISSSHDPYVNLSIEHHLLQHTPSSSTILFLYINRPCVVIGRNQNPWLEANLDALRYPALYGLDTPQRNDSPTDLHRIDLVRRRSGGGAVFHDPGNVNYCVICPPANFTRDKHACMVTKAVRELNPRARVNERHDIVLDQGLLLRNQGLPLANDVDDCHTSGYDTTARRSLKISGSAYKLTRTRALHHGTCLICSPMVGKLSRVLHSPADGHIQARGVDSVRSPVSNVLMSTKDTEEVRHATMSFQRAVIIAFCRMYQIKISSQETVALLKLSHQQTTHISQINGQTIVGVVGDELTAIEDIRKGLEELKSPDWTYGQTPYFRLSTDRVQESAGELQAIAQENPDVPASFSMELTARNGKVLSASLQLAELEASTQLSGNDKLSEALVGQKVYEVDSWEKHLEQQSNQSELKWSDEVGAWLDMAFNHRRAKEAPSIHPIR